MSSCLDDILWMDVTVVLSDKDILEAQLSEKEDTNYETDMSLLHYFTTNMSSSLNDTLPMVITLEDSDEERRSKTEFSIDEGTNHDTDISIPPNSFI